MDAIEKKRHQNITPVGNRVLVELIKISNTTESGFILSNEDKVEQQKGKVIAKGAGFGEEKEALAGIKAGDIVHFTQYGGENIKNEEGEIVRKIVDIGSVFAVEQK